MFCSRNLLSAKVANKKFMNAAPRILKGMVISKQVLAVNLKGFFLKRGHPHLPPQLSLWYWKYSNKIT
jgi:hypothetical protein